MKLSNAYHIEHRVKTWENSQATYLPVVVLLLSIVMFGLSHVFNLSSQYIAFYVVIEFLSVFMCFSIALTLWYTYEYSEGFLRILGSSFLIISCLKLWHVLTFPGMPQFLADNSTGITMWFWLFARILESIVLLVSGFIEYRGISLQIPRTGSFLLAILFSAVTVYLISSQQSLFKATWVATDSHFLSGIIIVLLLGAMVLFGKKLKKSGHKNDRLIICGIITAIFSEIALSVHSVDSDAFNLLGHLYKLVSYAFIFHVLFGQTVRKPFADLEDLLNQTVAAVSRALDRRDKYTFNHSVRVAEYACVIGQVLQVDKQLKKNLKLSGLLHDIGKIAIPDSVLN